jgi:7-cyano-7-deazaguanine synthase
LDSTVALAEVVATPDITVALTLSFDYGQRAWPAEAKASAAIAAYYGLPRRVVALPWLADLLPLRLKPEAALTAPASAVAMEDTPAVWVPNRNGVLLNVAAAFAEHLGAQWVVFGANADEAQGFPDNTQAFREAQTQAFAYSTLTQVQVLTPVGQQSKAAIVARGQVLGAPLHLVWSCYEAGPHPCQRCPSCRRLQTALAQNPATA